MEQVDRSLCTGCFACVDICPQRAISVVESDNGFKYPLIDNTRCVDCALCESVCGYRKPKNDTRNIIGAYGLQHNDADVLKDSTSGGAFTAISDIIIEHGGYVAGSMMDHNLRVRHILTNEKVERDYMRGSKYVQSDMEGLYHQIDTVLKKDKPVLFVGTPCQAGAIKLFFGENENLFVVDMLCHGVPSEKMFRDHLKYIEDTSKKECEKYYFRSKEFGWIASTCEGVQFRGDDKITFSYYMQSLSKLYNSYASLRPSCHHCVFRSLYRHSDITIADFWGLERVKPEKANKSGSSLLLVNSSKGERLLDKLTEMKIANIYPVPVEDILFRIPLKPQKESENAHEFWKTYEEKGYAELVKRYTSTSIMDRAKFELKKAIRRKDAVK